MWTIVFILRRTKLISVQNKSNSSNYQTRSFGRRQKCNLFIIIDKSGYLCTECEATFSCEFELAGHQIFDHQISPCNGKADSSDRDSFRIPFFNVTLKSTFVSENLGYYLWCTISIVSYFQKHDSLPLGQI